MDPSLVLNVTAIAISVCALGASTLLTARQTRLQQRANHLPALVGLLGEFRSTEFHRNYDYVCTRLPAEHTPEAGISGLPDAAKDAVLDAAYYFQMFAVLVKLDILDEHETLALLRHRVVRVWDVIAPYVHRERELNPAAGGLTVLEHFADRARSLPDDPAVRLLERPRRARS